jgi:Leucine-rich repeat (LRR) protein
VSIQSLNVTGPLPAEIFSSSSLRYLKLDFLNISAPLPVASSNCALQTLSIEFSALTGSVDMSISNCSALVSLQLEYNQLTGTLPRELFLLPKLDTLLMGHNQISDIEPPLFLNYSALRPVQVQLSYNNFSGPISQNLLRAMVHYGNFMCVVSMNPISMYLNDLIHFALCVGILDTILSSVLDSRLRLSSVSGRSQLSKWLRV